MKKNNKKIEIDHIRRLIESDMKKVNSLIETSLSSEVALINQLSHYIIKSGGKRLRPILVILSAKACGYKKTQHINIATIIEFIHTATLLHDDVVDASLLRRGHATVNQRWGNEASVLVGDFVFSRSFQMMAKIDSIQVMQIMAKTTNIIAEGEVQQLINRHNPNTTKENYFRVIQNKTAKLFEAAAHLGAIISPSDEKIELAMAAYGIHLGTAFQLIDDALDYGSSTDDIGKNIGDDIAEGKPTLPLLYAMWNGTEKEASIIKNSIKNSGLKEIEEIKSAIKSTGAIEYIQHIAKKEADMAIKALDCLPSSDYLDALYSLAKFSTERQY